MVSCCVTWLWHSEGVHPSYCIETKRKGKSPSYTTLKKKRYIERRLSWLCWFTIKWMKMKISCLCQERPSDECGTGVSWIATLTDVTGANVVWFTTSINQKKISFVWVNKKTGPEKKLELLSAIINSMYLEEMITLPMQYKYWKNNWNG